MKFGQILPSKAKLFQKLEINKNILFFCFTVLRKVTSKVVKQEMNLGLQISSLL